MSHKVSGQNSLADSFIRTREGLNDRLERIDKVIDWQPLAGHLSRIYSSRRGRPSHPPLSLFKALLLAQWYNLSDYELEAAIDDRLSFRRFVGVGVDAPAPDHSVYSRFRDQLISHGLRDRLFAELESQLDTLGMLVKSGTLVDATIVAAAVARPPKNEDGSGGKSDVDPEAEWTAKGNGKNKRFHFGYKGHVGVDEWSGLVRRQVLTGAGRPDGKMLEALLCGDEPVAIGDSGYGYGENREALVRRRVGDMLMRPCHARDELGKKLNRMRNHLETVA